MNSWPLFALIRCGRPSTADRTESPLPAFIGCGCLYPVVAQLRFHFPLRRFVAKLKAQTPVNPAGMLVIAPPPFLLQRNMDTPIAIANHLTGPIRPYSFRLMTSCSISLFRLKIATKRLSRTFSSSTVVPSSACFNMNAVYYSVNLLFLMPKSLRLTNAKPNQGFSQKIQKFIGSRPVLRRTPPGSFRKLVAKVA